MRGVEGKIGKRRFSFSYILLIMSIVVYLGSWAYSSYANEWRAKRSAPQIDGILKIIKGLREYQSIHALFPPTFNEVEAQVWKQATRPDFGALGRSIVLHNYYYFYTPIGPTRCTLWAIPVGPNTSEANTFFLILTPTDREKWKGPPLSLKEASAVSGNPSYAQLALLGMVKRETKVGATARVH
jgi:hypothetical protein